MPLGQFDERLPVFYAQPFNAYTPSTIVALGPVLDATVRLDAVVFINYDSVEHDVTLWLNDGSQNNGVVSFKLPVGDGVGNVGSVTEVLSSTLPAQQQFLIGLPGYQFKVSDTTAVVGAGVVCWGRGGAF